MIRRQTSSDAVPVGEQGDTNNHHAHNSEIWSDPVNTNKPPPDSGDDQGEEKDSKTPLTVIVEPATKFFTNPEYD